MQFDHLSSVQDFIENVIPEMLTENFIPRAELRETTMAILNRKMGEINDLVRFRHFSMCISRVV